MIARHTLLYLGSRGVAAALNLGAVAAFTRLAPPETYGGALYLLSWAMVLYGATCQWPKFAFFALYDEARAPEQAATVLRILAGTLGVAALAAGLCAAFGLVPVRDALGILAAAAGMTLFEGALEMARTRLAAGAVALAVALRAVLVVGLGSLVLAASHDPLALVLAMAAANALAALPALLALGPLLGGRPNRREAGRLLAYGWPLVLSFGLAALAQSLDRIIVGRAVGAQELGAYGAIADFLRQSFVVFGEAVALSLISIAKRASRDGGFAAAEPVLREAARVLALVAAFGAVFVLAYGDVLVAWLLGPAYRAGALELAPVLVAASILMMWRAFYFGQVIYFSETSRLDAVSAFAMLAVVAGLSAILVPRLGVMGAAIAFAASQAAGCLVLAVAPRLLRLPVRMPLPAADLGVIAAAALACAAAVAGLGLLPGGAAARWAGIVVLGAGFLATAWHCDVAGLATALRRRGRVPAAGAL